VLLFARELYRYRNARCKDKNSEFVKLLSHDINCKANAPESCVHTYIAYLVNDKLTQ
jgi:hypothetical protein